MKEYTKEVLSRILTKEDEQQLKDQHEITKRSRYYCLYHIQPLTGLMNDPNGFSYYQGYWHLFYQWFPFGAVHGMKHWYHVVSKDLISWENKGVALIPGDQYDNKGCYSGTAFEKDGLLYLFYTGNQRDENNVRHPYQLLATLDEKGKIRKISKPLIEPVVGYSEHQRDPKVFYRKEDKKYYMILGVQDNDKKGKLLMFQSEKLTKDWKEYGQLSIRGYSELGYMIECPDIERLGDQWLLLFSPQGLEKKKDKYCNKFNNVYLIGQIDFDNREFIPMGEMEELDKGLDFYASQCAFQRENKDECYLSAWFGVSDYSYPASENDGFVGAQSLIRRLSIEDGKLKQRPVDGWQKIKKEIIYNTKENVTVKMISSSIMEIEVDDKALNIELFAGEDHLGFVISYDPLSLTFSIERGHMDEQFNIEYGTSRKIKLLEGLRELLIFIDQSTIEIFVNDGEYVLSSRVFPTERENLLRINENPGSVKVYSANKMVSDDFVLFAGQ